MKNNATLNTKLFQLTVIGAIIFAAACSDNSAKTDDPAKAATEENNTKFDNKKLEKDAQFLVDAAGINLEEIQLGQLAQEKSGNADVKALGKMMEEGHSKSQKEVIALAKKKLVTIPDSVTSKMGDAYSTLSAKTGSDFDKAYCEKMVDGHKKAIATFEKESAESRDGELKDWAAGMLPDLRMHLDHVFACQKKCEKM